MVMPERAVKRQRLRAPPRDLSGGHHIRLQYTVINVTLLMMAAKR